MANHLCTIEGCGRVEQLRRGLCNLHRMRMKAHGDPLKTTKAPNGTGYRMNHGYWMHEIDGRCVLRHILVAERALGHRLPLGAQVHHVDLDRSNDDPSNLVICPDSAYHQLLHIRTAAYNACGHWDWRKCHICQQYDDPANLRFYKPSGLIRHIECWRRRYQERKRLGHRV